MSAAWVQLLQIVQHAAAEVKPIQSCGKEHTMLRCKSRPVQQAPCVTLKLCYAMLP
jgi:hypothetical protein